MLPTRMRPEQKAPAATLIWREGADERGIGNDPRLVIAGRSFDRRERACRGCPPELRSSALSAHKRKRASQGRGSRKKRPFTGYCGGGQPVLDHHCIGRKRLSRPLAGRPP